MISSKFAALVGRWTDRGGGGGGAEINFQFPISRLFSCLTLETTIDGGTTDALTIEATPHVITVYVILYHRIFVLVASKEQRRDVTPQGEGTERTWSMRFPSSITWKWNKGAQLAVWNSIVGNENVFFFLNVAFLITWCCVNLLWCVCVRIFYYFKKYIEVITQDNNFMRFCTISFAKIKHD